MREKKGRRPGGNGKGGKRRKKLQMPHKRGKVERKKSEAGEGGKGEVFASRFQSDAKKKETIHGRESFEPHPKERGAFPIS